MQCGYMLVPLSMVFPDPLAMWTNSEKHWLGSDHTLLVVPIYVDQRAGGTSLVTYRYNRNTYHHG